jgi:2-octaprenylphenol hydroxylase
MSRQLTADVIIAGGGLAGAAIAALLAVRGLRCLVLEERTQQAVAERNDPRTLAITRASENILRHAGAWENLPAARIGYFRKMHLWDESGPGDISFDSAEICESTLGYIIEQVLLEQALRAANDKSDLVQYLQPARLSEVKPGEKRVDVLLEDGTQLGSRLIIGADGAKSRLRTLAGIACPAHDYHQQAVACVVRTEKAHDSVARQRFLQTGPLAFLPMADPHQCGIVWSTAPEHAKLLLEMDEPGFNEVLGGAFDHTLGNILSGGPRAVFPLQHAQADHYCQPRLALIGDAAHTIHPLAGQGANMGLLDAAVLAEVIIEARTKNRDIGAYQVLRRYERWRRGENYLMIKVLHGLKLLFASRLASIRHLRNIGLDITDMLTPVKHTIMRHAMGLAGDLPSFAQNLSQN